MTQPQGPILPNGVSSPSSDTDGDAFSVTIPVPKEIQRSISVILSALDKFAPVDQHPLIPIITVVCVETTFLKWISRSNEDVLATIFFTFLLGSFAWPVWANLKRMHCRLDEVFGKIEVLQQSIKSLESIPVPAIPIVPPVLLREDPPQMGALEQTTKHVKPVQPDPERLVEERPAASDKHPYPPYEIPVSLEPVKPIVVIENSPPSAPPVAPEPDISGGIIIQGLFENIIEAPTVDTADNSTEQHRSQPAPTEPAHSRWLSTLREIKQRIQQFAEGRFPRSSHIQGEPSINVSLRRYAIRLLMSHASLSPADFVSPVGYLGPQETTPYYPTGDLREDRSLTFNTAMDSIDDLEVYLQGNDDVRIATKLSELAQSLSDLGLREYALDISGFALDIFEQPYLATPNNHRLHVASVLALQANILCDLKRNEEGRDAAERAVTLCKEHRDSQTGPVPELAYTLLNYAVLLTSIGLKDESAAVAFELLGEVDESEPEMKNVSALCKLCLSSTRIGDDDDMALSMAEETMELTHSSSDGSSQTVLVGALLNRSKILSSRGENDTAVSTSAEAVTLLRSISTTRPVFTLFLAHALDAHAHNLFKASRQGESYSTIHDAVELWQTLRVSAPGALARPLAWALFELAKFRHKGGDRNALREELRIAESAVDMFREGEPVDAPGLAEALYLFADRMLELDKNQEAATYVEESVHYFREASSKDQKYALDLIFSLSLASSCLACTERANDAFEYAKQAVEVQHERKGAEDEQYGGHLQKLLMDVVFRATEIDRQDEAFPWFQELQALGALGDDSTNPLARRSGNSQGRSNEYRKQTSYWMDSNLDMPPRNGSSSSAPMPSSSALTLDKGKGKEVAPPERPISRVDKGKEKAVSPSFEEIVSPGAAAAAAAQRRFAGFGNPGGLSGNMFGGGPGGNDLLNGLLGMGGGRGMGGSPLGGSGIPGLGMGMGGLGMGGGGMGGSGRPGSPPSAGGRTMGGPAGMPGLAGMGGGLGGMGMGMGGPGPGGRRMGGMGGLGGLDDMGSLGGGMNGLTDSLLGNLSKLGPDFFKQGGEGNDSSNTDNNLNNNKTDNNKGDGGARGGARSQPSSTTHTGTWSGTGIQSKLSDDGA